MIGIYKSALFVFFLLLSIKFSHESYLSGSSFWLCMAIGFIIHAPTYLMAILIAERS